MRILFVVYVETEVFTNQHLARFLKRDNISCFVKTKFENDHPEQKQRRFKTDCSIVLRKTI